MGCRESYSNTRNYLHRLCAWICREFVSWRHEYNGHVLVPTEAVKAANDLGMRISTGGIFFDYPGIGNRSHEDFLQEAEKIL